ncbi:tyrosine-type recombinase/integrase [Mesorhizobium marinum]|uniref:tyrosine-type recombinase/integrase n=1 Tax=Mesorhizobium marinum TaxID=3228790 RepID=UPI00346763FA
MSKWADHLAKQNAIPPPDGNQTISFTYGGERIVKKVDTYTISELFSAHGAVLWQEGRHKDNVRSFLGEIDEILLGQRFSTFDQETLDGLVQALRDRGNSNATINRKMAALSKLLRKAYKMGNIYNLPEFRRQKEKSGRIRFLEIDEEDRLFDRIRFHSVEYHELSVFLVDTGARLGEAIGLRWNDIHNGSASFWLTKSGRSRSVPLTSRVKDILSGMDRRSPGPFAKIKQYQFRAVWHKAKAEIGLATDSELVPHTLRHTCASRLVRGGIDIRRVQMWLGHQTLQMTMRYSHLATHDLDVCVPVLERR